MTLKFKMGLTDDITKDALIVCVLLGLFAIIGVGDNLLVFRTLVKYKPVRIGLFALAGGLAVADLCFLLFGVPIGILYQLKKFDFLYETEPLCRVEAYLSHTFSYIAAYHLVAFAVLRAIVLTSRSRTGPTFKQGLLCSVLLWALALVANIPMLTSFEEESGEYADWLSLCIMRFDYSTEQFLLLTLGFSFLLPVVLIVLIYLATYLVCRRFCENSFSEHQVQFSKLVTAVVCVFVACWLPVNILHMLILYKSLAAEDILEQSVALPEHDKLFDELDTLYVIRDYFIGIAHLDKFIRPIIYATMSKDFNRSFDEIINCKICFENRQSSENSASTTPLACNPDPLIEANV